MSLDFGSQSRIHFEPDKLKEIGVTQIFVTPFQVNAESFQGVETFKKNVQFIKEKVYKIRQNWKEVKVIINMFTICHPEGNFRLPTRFSPQLGLEGQIRPGFVCFLDEQRQSELLQMYRIIAEEGFEYVLIDDDFRDALCFCDRHIKMFKPFKNKTREELTRIFNNKMPSDEDVKLKRQWLDFKKGGLFNFATKIEKTLHSINPKLRIGVCISAKRLNDLSGRSLMEWLNIFDTSDAPVFIRLAGEHYDERSLGISQSVGWHQYYRELLPDNMEKMAEVTYVHPVYFKSPASISLETKIHLACGLKKVLLAWTDDYKYNNGWKMLREEKRQFEIIKEKSKDYNNSVGIAIYTPENCAEYIPFDEISRAEPIRSYQGLGLMGFPVKMTSRIDVSNKVTFLTGYLPDGIKTEIESYLDRGGILVMDALASQSVKEIGTKELVKYKIGKQISGLRMEKVISIGEVIDELASFPHTSVYCVEIKEGYNDKVEPISEIYDVDGKRKGLGSLIYTVRKGWIIVLAYDLCQVEYRICSQSYRKLLTYIFEKAGYEPEVQLLKNLFVQPLLFEKPQNRLVLVNYNSYQAEVNCKGEWTRGRDLIDGLTGEEVNPEEIRILPLDIKILEFN